MRSTDTRSTWRWAAPALLASALALTSCGTQVAGGGAGSDPTVLHIGSPASAESRNLGAPAIAGAATTKMGDPYVLEGTLPTGPSSAPVYRYADGQVAESTVTTLAASLGVTAAPVRHVFGWVATSSAGTLKVRDNGGSWSFSRDGDSCPMYSVDVDNAGGASSSASCAIAVPPTEVMPCPPTSSADVTTSVCSTPGTTPTPTLGADVSTAAARAAASPVLDAAGVSSADSTRLEPSGPVRNVVVDPLVEGIPTQGIRTMVSVDDHGVLGATGFLATATSGPSYPLITAKEALDRLRALPRPEIAIMCVQGQVCQGIGPQTVTGATLGLQLRFDDATAVLVPSWFFTIKGSPDPLTLVAVQDAYLGDPTQVDPGAGGTEPGATSAPDSGSSGGGSVGGGSVNPPSPVAVPPGGPDGSGPVISGLRLGTDASTLLVTTVVGICEDYVATAEETATTVTVTITGTPQDPAQACAAIAQELTLEVRLASPWDNRTVIDSATGSPVAMG